MPGTQCRALNAHGSDSQVHGRNKDEARQSWAAGGRRQGEGGQHRLGIAVAVQVGVRTSQQPAKHSVTLNGDERIPSR